MAELENNQGVDELKPAVDGDAPIITTTGLIAEAQNRIEEHHLEQQQQQTEADVQSSFQQTHNSHEEPPTYVATDHAASQTLEEPSNDQSSAPEITETPTPLSYNVEAVTSEAPQTPMDETAETMAPVATATATAAQDANNDNQMADEQNLEADEFDSDSALGDDTESTTTSLSQSIFNYRTEHGRTYHAYKDGKYIFPNDERESDRLDLQHHLFCMTFGNKLHFAPLNDPKHALDVGTGTGIWAMDFADQYPDCNVIGIDLSPTQPTMVPPNLKFVVDDAEDMWLYQDKFDYVHARLLAGCFTDWQRFFRQAYENIEPGGWIELQDYGLPVKSADGTADGTNIERWGELLCEAALKMGRPMGSDACDLYEQGLREAGFVDVQTRMFMWPTNAWPKDSFMKELGHWNMVNCMDGLEGFCLALLIRGLDWKKEEVDVLVAQVSKDFRNKRIHAYFPMPVTMGRKPFEGEVAFR